MGLPRLSLLSWVLAANVTLGSRRMVDSGSLRLALLPRSLPGSAILNRITFTETVRLISHTPLILEGCATSRGSDFALRSTGPLSLLGFDHRGGAISVNHEKVLVRRSTFRFERGDSMSIANAPSADLESSRGSAPAVSLSSVALARFRSCNFSGILAGAIRARGSAVEVSGTTFSRVRGAAGAALDFDGDSLLVSAVDARGCVASVAGGAFLFRGARCASRAPASRGTPRRAGGASRVTSRSRCSTCSSRGTRAR